MRIIDGFFEAIDAFTKWLQGFEEWYMNRKEHVPKIIVTIVVIALVLILCGQMIAGICVFSGAIVLSVIDGVIGWRSSVRKWLKIGVVYNIYCSLFLAEMVQMFFKQSSIVPLFIFLYIVIWVILSLIADNKVALYVNEMISGVSAALFSIGTFVISVELKRLPSDGLIGKYFEDEERFITALGEGNALALQFLHRGLLEVLEISMVFFLPIMGGTVMALVMLKTKDYWDEKRKHNSVREGREII